MGAISFTQFMLPHGRQVPVSIERPDDISQKAEAIIGRGFRFECERLTTGEASLTIANDDGDADIEIVTNGNAVPDAVDRMINRFFSAEFETP